MQMTTSGAWRLAPSYGLVAILITVFAGFAVWLAWPGFATHDTLFVTKEAAEGEFTTYHPLLNGLLIWLIAVPFESFAPYTLIQVAFCSLLFGRSLFLAFGAKVDWRVWLAVAIWMLSVPTLLYLGMIWKDVPIAYALTYVAALGFRLRSDGQSPVSRLDSVLLGAALVVCVSLRHGMVFNLVAVPLLLGIRHVAANRRLWGPHVASGVVALAIMLLSHSNIVKNDDVHLMKLKISAVSQPFLSIISNRNGYSSDDFSYDAALAEQLFGPNYKNEYTPDYFRNHVAVEDLASLESGYDAILRRTPRLCLMNVATCVGGRLQMFIGTLQPSTRFGGMTFYDLGAMPSCATVFGMGETQCSLLEEFESGERSSAKSALIYNLQRAVAERRGLLQNLLVWNLLPAALLLILVLVLSGPAQPMWMVATFFVVQCGLPFATAMANDFRYYYFLSPYMAIFAPLALASVVPLFGWRKRRAPA